MNSMRRLIYIVAAALAVSACGLYEERFDDLHRQLDSLKNEVIKPLAEQVEAIDVTVENAEETQVALRQYITELDSELGSLNGELSNLDEAIAKLNEDIAGQISSMETDVRAQISSQKAYIEGLIKTVNMTLERLRLKDEELSGLISDLKTYADQEISNTKDWTSSTYATLEQYNDACDVLGEIEGTIEEMNEMLSASEMKFRTSKMEIEQAMASLDETLKGEINTLEANVAREIASFKTNMETAYKAALQKSLEDSEASMKEWINSQLAGYYSAAATDAQLEVYKSRIEASINAQTTYLEGVVDSLRTALNGKINANSSLIEQLRKDIEKAASTESSYATRIAGLSSDITTNATNISKNADAIKKNNDDITSLNQLVAQNKELIIANQNKIAELKEAIKDLNLDLDDEKILIEQDARAIQKNIDDIATVSELISKNASAISSNQTAISQNTEDIAALKDSVAAVKTRLTAAYKAAIAEAIEDADGRLSAALSERVSSVNAQIDSFMLVLDNRIDSIEDRIDAVEQEISDIKDDFATIQTAIQEANDNIAKLFARIQSVTWLPESTDGTAAARFTIGEKNATATLRFKVLPSGTAEQLATHSEFFSAVYVATITKAQTEIALPVMTVSATGDLLAVKIDCSSLPDAFYSGTAGASVSVVIADGNNAFQTSYVPLKAMGE